MRMMQFFMTNHRCNSRFRRLGQIDNDKSRIAANVGIVANNRYSSRAAEQSVRIKDDILLKEIVIRLAI